MTEAKQATIHPQLVWMDTRKGLFSKKFLIGRKNYQVFLHFGISKEEMQNDPSQPVSFVNSLMK